MSTARASVPLELVTVGTELLLGQTVDTNSAFAGRALATIGIRIARRTSVPDDAAAIRDAVAAALQRTGLVLVTGGLGPTRDDITKEAVAGLLDAPLAYDDGVWEQIRARYATLGREPAASNRSQAMVPRGAIVLPNRWGTAPGLWIEGGYGVVIMLPGVPHEMTRLMEHEVLPRLAPRGGGVVVRSRTLRTSGVPESTLGELVDPLTAALDPLTLAYLPAVDGVDLRLTSWDADPTDADRRLEAGLATLREVAGEWAWGVDDDDLAAVVLRLAEAAGARIATAESCTGGMVAARLTAIPGSSLVMLGGVVAYDNAVKREQLDVPAGLLESAGAVSREVAEAMVRGIAHRTSATLAVAITGIAGPGGATPDKPVGTTWLARWHDGAIESWRVVFPGTRPEVRARATAAALLTMWRALRA